MLELRDYNTELRSHHPKIKIAFFLECKLS